MAFPRTHRAGVLFLLAWVGAWTPSGAVAADAPATPPAEPAPASPPPAAPVPRPRPRLSQRLSEQVRTAVPKWTPETAGGGTKKTVDRTPDPGVIPMDPVTAEARPVPKMDPLKMLTPKARDEVLVKEYLSEFDRTFLNRFTVPLFGVSKEARARMLYEEDKRLRELDEARQKIEVMKRLDPAEAKELSRIRYDMYLRPAE